jgi:hypothetical protein
MAKMSPACFYFLAVSQISLSYHVGDESGTIDAEQNG